jgi:hypothetical protein
LGSFFQLLSHTNQFNVLNYLFNTRIFIHYIYTLTHVIRRRTVLYGKVYTVYASAVDVTDILLVFQKKKQNHLLYASFVLQLFFRIALRPKINCCFPYIFFVPLFAPY